MNIMLLYVQFETIFLYDQNNKSIHNIYYLSIIHFLLYHTQ